MRRKITIKNLIFSVFISFIVLFINAFLASPVFASSTDGTIDSAFKYAWGENVGWVNFGTANGDVHITDSGMSGYALSETVGWIYLGDVVNDGEGNLSGLAWGENVGWVNFDPTNGGVSINSSGEFTGSALGENIGWIIFDCATSACVKTDYRPSGVRLACNNASDDDGDGKIDFPSDPGCDSLTDGDEQDPSRGSSGGSSRRVSGVTPNLVVDIADGITTVVDSIIPDFLQKNPEIVATVAVESTQEELPSFENSWDYLPASLVRNFIFAPLPSELAVFIQKYPDLGRIFIKLGVKTVADIERLEGVAISLPIITDLKDLPSEVFIALGGAGNIEVSSTITLDDTGKVEQRIETTSNTSLTLAVRPSSPVDSVNGYLIFKESFKKTVAEMSLDLQTASSILALQNTSTKTPTIPERELLVQTFSYEDSDNDGVFTADIKTPAVEGTYEVITLINYTDKSLGTKELRLVTVVDPEGYVYYLNSNGDEARVSKAVISIFNANTNALWDALSYNQTNPQITDSSGKYSFLVPEGKYYITAERNGYQSYKSASFEVREGSGVHFNIELRGSGWFAKLDWTTVLLSLIILILGSTFAGYAIHEHMLKRGLARRS